MKRIFKIVAEITADAFHNFVYFIKSNLITFAGILGTIAPYTMYFIGQYVAYKRDIIAVGGEAFIPLVFFIIIFYLKSAADKIGKGVAIPIPDKRFTQVDDDGEVSIENKRIQEMLLYMADLEDWMERKGIL